MTEPETQTWGPFTGRQLTIIIVALFATVVLVPTAVFAVPAAKSVIIQDGTTAANKASVAGGKLKVGDGLGNLTVDGSVGVSDGAGPLTIDGNATVTGTAGAVAAPSQLVVTNHYVTHADGCMPLVGPAAPGEHNVITGMHISPIEGSARSWASFYISSDPGECGTIFDVIPETFFVGVNADEDLDVPLGPGIDIPPGKFLSVQLSGNGVSSTNMNIASFFYVAPA